MPPAHSYNARSRPQRSRREPRNSRLYFLVCRMVPIRQAVNPGELMLSHIFTGKISPFSYPLSAPSVLSSEAGERQVFKSVCLPPTRITLVRARREERFRTAPVSSPARGPHRSCGSSWAPALSQLKGFILMSSIAFSVFHIRSIKMGTDPGKMVYVLKR